MSGWTGEELSRIGEAEELRIATRRGDGSLRSPRTIWVVPHGGDLYVRSVNGPTAGWYRGTRTGETSRIDAGGVERAVTFVDTVDDTALNDTLDAAYRDKYRRYAQAVVDSMTSPLARSTTMRLVPA